MGARHVVIVCGGGDFTDALFVANRLDDYHATHGITRLAHGCAPGADLFARRWALAHHIDVVDYPADWSLDGRAAGPIRNGRMLSSERPDAVLAFPGGRGTADMVRRARNAGVPVVEYVYVKHSRR